MKIDHVLKTEKIKFPLARQSKVYEIIGNMRDSEIKFIVSNGKLSFSTDGKTPIELFHVQKVSEFATELAEVVGRVKILMQNGWKFHIAPFNFKKVITETMYLLLEQSDYLDELTLYRVDVNVSGKETKNKLAQGLSWFIIPCANAVALNNQETDLDTEENDTEIEKHFAIA